MESFNDQLIISMIILLQILQISMNIHDQVTLSMSTLYYPLINDTIVGLILHTIFYA